MGAFSLISSSDSSGGSLPLPSSPHRCALSFTGIWCGHHSLPTLCSMSTMVIGVYKTHQGVKNCGFYFSTKENFGPWTDF